MDNQQKAHILIVEDEQKIRTALVDFLEFHGFKVSTTADGLEAQRIINEKKFDLILLDLMLPRISGEQLCTGWRQEGLQTPIIMLTAKGQEKEKVAGLNLGADDYITKPFSLEELLARIEAVLRLQGWGSLPAVSRPHMRGRCSAGPQWRARRASLGRSY